MKKTFTLTAVLLWAGLTACSVQPMEVNPSTMIASITLSEGSLYPAFSPEQSKYCVDLDGSVETIDISAGLGTNAGSYEIILNGSASGSTLALEYGLNDVKIRLYTEDRSAYADVTVEVARGIKQNRTILTIHGITINDPAYIIQGPGYTVDRTKSYYPGGDPDYEPTFSTPHDLIFEMDGADANNMKFMFELYEQDPVAFGTCHGSILIPNFPTALSYHMGMTWTFSNMEPVSVSEGINGRTRFTWAFKEAPGTNLVWYNGTGNYGNAGAREPGYVNWVEISGVTITPIVLPVIDPVNHTVTFYLDYQEAVALENWMFTVAKGTSDNRDMSLISKDPVTLIETVRTNYFQVFPIEFEHQTGFGLSSYGKVMIKMSYDYREEA